MLFEMTDACVHAEMVDGGIQLSVGFDGSDVVFSDAAASFLGGNAGLTELYGKFSVSSILDGIVERFGLSADGHPLDVESKPMIEALRTELSALIDRIDTLTFETPD